MTSILFAAAAVSVIGLLGAVILVLASHFMHVEEDARVGLVQERLPGANCGACGYAGCADYAKAIVAGAPVNKCVPGGAKAAQAVAAVMGVDAGDVARRKAVVTCAGTCEKTGRKFDYEGIESCAASAALYGGAGACEYGCLGYGDCVKVCEFNALSIKDGIAHVNQANCTGCGECAKICPKQVIWIRPECAKPAVLCANRNPGAQTRKACSAGCIACKKCEKACPTGAIQVHDNVARINYETCTGCGECVKACPVQVIEMQAG